MEILHKIGSPDWVITHIINEINHFIKTSYRIEMRLMVKKRGTKYSELDLLNIPKQNLEFNNMHSRDNEMLTIFSKVYFLFNKSEIVYIGITESKILTRLYGHKNKDFTHFTFFQVAIPRRKLEQLETKLINIFMPVLNVAKKIIV